MHSRTHTYTHACALGRLALNSAVGVQRPSASIAACSGQVFGQTSQGLQVILLAAFTVAATKWEAKRVRLDPEHADPELRRMLSDDTGTLHWL